MIDRRPSSPPTPSRCRRIALGVLLVLGASLPASAATLTFSSIASHDGRIRELTEFAGIGGVLEASDAGGTALRVGDSTGDEQWRSILSFDTSPLPDSAVILAARLEMPLGVFSGINPYGTHLPCQVDIKTGFFGAAVTLELVDFQAAASETNVATLSDPALTLLSSGLLNQAGLKRVNKTGFTQLRVDCNLDDDDDLSEDFAGFYSGNTTDTAKRPRLVVVY